MRKDEEREYYAQYFLVQHYTASQKHISNSLQTQTTTEGIMVAHNTS